MLVRPSDFTARLLPHLQNRPLTVHSLFERSVNLSVTPTVLITITSPSLGMSPFGLAAGGDLAPLLPLLQRAKVATFRSGTFWCSGRQLLTVAPSPPYCTHLEVKEPRPSLNAAGFHRILQELATGGEGGLAQLLPEWPLGRPLSQASQATRPLPQWVASAHKAMGIFDHGSVPEMERAAGLLLGLGVGLTPSGDDFLLGFLAGRLAQGHRHEIRRLSLALSHSAMSRTTLVSASYLRHAFRGRFSSQIRHLIRLLHDPAAKRHDILQAVSQVTAVGSTSGWDSLTGLLTSLYRYESKADPDSPQ